MQKRHQFNLFTSLSLRSSGNATSTTVYLVPGYKFWINRGWNFGLEYYLTNTCKLPIKTLQYLMDSDGTDFNNSSRDFYSFMVYGIHYNGKHFYFGLDFANHLSFTGPIIPLLGLGWNF